MFRFFAFICLAALALATSASAYGVAPATSRGTERRATIFFTGSVEGEIEPCGCTSDPLGDVSRMADVVRREARSGRGVLLLDAGNLSYRPSDLSARRQDAADMKAAFFAEQFAKLPFGGAALGASDLARGVEKLQPKRLAANVKGPFVLPSQVHTVGGIKIGVLGVTTLEVARANKLSAEDPVTAAAREAKALRAQGAEVVVALAPMERSAARQIARGADVDFVIVGQDPGKGLERADTVGKAFILAPAADLQKLGRLEIVLRTGAQTERTPLVDAGGPDALSREREELELAVKELSRTLEAWQKDASADRTFVAAKQKDLAEKTARLAELKTLTWRPPQTGSYFSSTLVPLRRALPRDPQVAAAMQRLDAQMGKASLAHAEPPPKAEAGRASFVGNKACVTCHKTETAFWKTTVHAGAWKTLVVGGKTAQEDCVSCHVTGFGEIGGSSLGYVKNLEAIQCETCHGPGSLHVAAEGLEDPPAVHRTTPESTCIRCHNEKHSDTFQYVAYLRDVLGPGHGAEARAKLGPGPTGGALRKAAKARAAAAGKTQAKAM